MTKHITRVECPEDQRIDFLFNIIGRDFLRYEGLTYNFMEMACEGYKGGYWNFYTLSNGGFYTALNTDERLKLIWSDNYFEGEMSADAAGIAINLMVQNAFAWEVDPERFSANFHALRDYAAQHKEIGPIFGFID